jgi:predicted RNase H-like nuclease (RuvC/YqgF family)
MKASHKVLRSILVILGIIALVSCGVSKQDYEKAVSELNKAKADLAQANTKIADMEKSLNEAQAQLKSQAEKPSPAAGAEKPGTAVAPQKEAADCRAKVETLTKENAGLKALIDKLKAEYAELQKKLGGATQQLPAGIPKKP